MSKKRGAHLRWNPGKSSASERANSWGDGITPKPRIQASCLLETLPGPESVIRMPDGIGIWSGSFQVIEACGLVERGQASTLEEALETIPGTHRYPDDLGLMGIASGGKLTNWERLCAELNAIDNDPIEQVNPLNWLKGEAVEQLPDTEPEVIIEGLLHIGEKLGITAASKSFKTWLLLYLAYAIANGLPFLGRKTRRSRVIFFDLELSPWGIRRRLERIQKELGEGDFENLKVCSLRGKASRFCTHLVEVTNWVKEQKFEVVFIDPAYKFLLGKEENSNGVVAGVLEELTEFCASANVALIYVHHHSKGSQAAKDSLDRGSGAGAWSRDPDVVLDLTEHDESTKEDRLFCCEITVREFAPLPKFVVCWQFPLLVLDRQDRDPEKLKCPPSKNGRPKNENEEIILAVIRAFEPEGGVKTKAISEATLIHVRTVRRRLKALSPHKVVKSVLKGGFQLSVAEAQRLKNFKADNGSEEGDE